MAFQFKQPFVNPFASKMSRTLLIKTDPPLSQIHLRRILGEIGPIRKLRMDPPQIEYMQSNSAEVAVLALNNQVVEDSLITLSEPTTFNVFVGDIGYEVTDDILSNAFDGYESFKGARVMVDLTTNKSRGFGFVSFGSKDEAEKAIDEMNGCFVGSRQVRCNWASHKTSDFSFDSVMKQAKPSNSTVYIGNLCDDPSSIVKPFGKICSAKIHPDRGFAFFTLETHEQAARAIVGLNGKKFGKKFLKCGWGKDDEN